MVTLADFDLPPRPVFLAPISSPVTLRDSPSVISDPVPDGSVPLFGTLSFESPTVSGVSSVPQVSPMVLPPASSVPISSPLVSDQLLCHGPNHLEVPAPGSDPTLANALKKISTSATLHKNYPTISAGHNVASGRRQFAAMMCF